MDGSRRRRQVSSQPDFCGFAGTFVTFHGSRAATVFFGFSVIADLPLSRESTTAERPRFRTINLDVFT